MIILLTQGLPHIAADPSQVTKVSVAGREAGRAYADEANVTRENRVANAGAGGQSTADRSTCDEFSEAGLDDRRSTVSDRSHLFFVDVHTNDPIAHASETGR